MLNWLKDIRLERELTQKKVATLANITEAYYCLIENGKREPNVKLAKAIARILDFDWVLFFAD